MGAGPVPLPRADEQAHLDAGVVTRLGHVAQLGGAQQHRAAALRYPVDRDALGLGGAEHRVKHARALHAGDLDAERRAVWEGPWLAGMPRLAWVRWLAQAKVAEQSVDPPHRAVLPSLSPCACPIVRAPLSGLHCPGFIVSAPLSGQGAPEDSGNIRPPALSIAGPLDRDHHEEPAGG